VEKKAAVTLIRRSTAQTMYRQAISHIFTIPRQPPRRDRCIP